MTLKKSLLLLLAGILVFTHSFAQPDPPKDPSFKINLSNPAPKTGETVDLIITFDVPEGMHLYSTNVFCDVGPTPFIAEFPKSSSYCLVGKLTSVGDVVHMDEVFKCKAGEFRKKAKFVQKIKFLKANVSVKIRFEGQWCSESACFMFGNLIPIYQTIKVASTGPDKTCDEPDAAEVIPSVVEDTLKATAPIDTTTKSAITDTGKSTGVSYKINFPGDTAKSQVKSFQGKKIQIEEDNNWTLFLLAFLSGLIGLLTPCVFPMIPMTVSFFMKDDKKSKFKNLSVALFFGVSIVLIYAVIGTIISVLLGPAFGNYMATHWIPNLFFFVIFLVFAFSFFGAFEIVLPSFIANKADREADKGGYYGAFFMALTLVIVSFSCTGPIVSNVLVKSFGGEILRPVIAMLGFGLAFAFPFSFFALFPSYLNKLPKSGGWLNSVKVVLGFIELALSLKFLSIVDLTYHWHLLDREVYLAIWIVIFTLMGIYLLGKLKFSHDSDLPYLKVPRLLFAILTFSFVVYLIPGLWGAPLKGLAGYLPPMSTQDFDINKSIREANGLSGNICKKPKYSDQGLHVPLGLNGYFDYEDAIACGKEIGKPVFLDFTGHGCANCRKMEEKVWSDPAVYKLLKEEFVIASLYVDDKKIKLPPEEQFVGRYSKQQINTLGKKNTEIELCYFDKSQQPLYCILDENEELLQNPESTEINQKPYDVEEFRKFLENGLAEYKKRHANK